MRGTNQPCNNCGKTPSKLNRAHDMHLCTECEETDEYKMICKTDAKKEYFMTPSDLDQCDFINVSRRRGYADLVLYKHRDILKYFCTKHGIDIEDKDEIEAMRVKLADK